MNTQHLDHGPFARLLPSQRKSLLEEAAERFPFPAELVTFVTVHDRTYAMLKLYRDPQEYATFLVAFDHSRGGQVHFESGHYGFRTIHGASGAATNMYERASR